MFEKKKVELKNEKVYKLIRNISLGFLICLFLLYINKIFKVLELYLYDSNEVVPEILMIGWILFTSSVLFFSYSAFRLTGMKNINSVAASVFLSLGSVFIYMILLFPMMCSYMTNDIIYLNKNDVSKTIEIRDFNCGALDSDPPMYIYQIVYDFPPLFFYGRTIDTNEIDKSEWISLKFDVRSKNSSWSKLGPVEYKLINSIPDSSFNVLRKFYKKIEAKNNEHIINDKQWFCTVHRRKYFYRSFVYQSRGRLILNTLDYENKLIDDIELYCDIKEKDYNLKKTSYFENDSILVLNKYYETFDLDSNNIIIPDSKTNVNFKNRFLINYKGEIKDISGSRLGDVEIVLEM